MQLTPDMARDLAAIREGAHWAGLRSLLESKRAEGLQAAMRLEHSEQQAKAALYARAFDDLLSWLERAPEQVREQRG